MFDVINYEIIKVGVKNRQKSVKISNENIFWYGRSAKMAKTPIQKPVCFFDQKSTKNGNLGN
jgi:hypothetical protein